MSAPYVGASPIAERKIEATTGPKATNHGRWRRSEIQPKSGCANEEATAAAERAEARKTQVGSGDRSERIRTYNFPDNRVTDHRIGLTLYKLDRIMEGDIGEVFDALKLSARDELLRTTSSEAAS